MVSANDTSENARADLAKAIQTQDDLAAAKARVRVLEHELEGEKAKTARERRSNEALALLVHEANADRDRCESDTTRLLRRIEELEKRTIDVDAVRKLATGIAEAASSMENGSDRACLFAYANGLIDSFGEQLSLDELLNMNTPRGARLRLRLLKGGLGEPPKSGDGA